MNDTADDLDRVTRRDLTEGKIEKVLTRAELVPISDRYGGLRFDNALQIADAAKLMATAGPMLPPWLQGNPGACWSIIVRAQELRISPLALADWFYITTNKRGEQRIGWMSGFYRAIIEMRAPIKGRLRHEILGEGDDRRCRVWATFRGEDTPHEFITEPLSRLRIGRSNPEWVSKPTKAMTYDAIRDWARIYCEDVLAGLLTREEIEEADGEEPRVGPERAVDVTPPAPPAPALRLRLGEARPQRAEDLRNHTEAAIDAARKHQPAVVVSGGADPTAVPPHPQAVESAGADAAPQSASAPNQSNETTDHLAVDAHNSDVGCAAGHAAADTQEDHARRTLSDWPTIAGVMPK